MARETQWETTMSADQANAVRDRNGKRLYAYRGFDGLCGWMIWDAPGGLLRGTFLVEGSSPNLEAAKRDAERECSKLAGKASKSPHPRDPGS